MKKSPAAVLGHPLRIRILEVLNERDMSPSQFVAEELGADVELGPRGLSQVSYHFRGLAEAGCLEVIDLLPVRGSMEHIYRGTAAPLHTDAAWKRLTPEQRASISRITLLTMMARAESALMAGTFDRRIDRHQSWMAMDLDEDGWDELRDLLQGTLDEADAIRLRAAERIAADPDTYALRATFGALGFESPPRSTP